MNTSSVSDHLGRLAIALLGLLAVSAAPSPSPEPQWPEVNPPWRPAPVVVTGGCTPRATLALGSWEVAQQRVRAAMADWQFLKNLYLEREYQVRLACYRRYVQTKSRAQQVRRPYDGHSANDAQRDADRQIALLRSDLEQRKAALERHHDVRMTR